MSANRTQLFEEWLSLEKAGHTLSYPQIELIGEAFREAKPSDDVYALARLFPAYFPPTLENVGLLERFLQDETNDDLTLITKIASPAYLEFDDASMWFALSALGSAAVENSATRKALLDLATHAMNYKFEDQGGKKLYLQALREALHVASEGHDAILAHISPRGKIPSIEESVRVLKSRIGLR
jgi:hypothetical protein